MSEITLSFQCDPYLKQWFINECGGMHPVRLRRNSPESNCLQFALRPKSAGFQDPDTGDDPLIVYIPTFRFMNPETYNRITPTGRKMFISVLRQRFDDQLWYDMHSVYNFSISKDDLIYTWMESHGIENTETNFCSVAKRLQRMRNRALSKIRVREFRRKAKKRD